MYTCYAHAYVHTVRHINWYMESGMFYLVGSLMYLNEATLLNNLRIRYKKNQIYVSLYSV